MKKLLVSTALLLVSLGVVAQDHDQLPQETIAEFGIGSGFSELGSDPSLQGGVGNKPFELLFSPEGTLYISDPVNERIIGFDDVLSMVSVTDVGHVRDTDITSSTMHVADDGIVGRTVGSTFWRIDPEAGSISWMIQSVVGGFANYRVGSSFVIVDNFVFTEMNRSAAFQPAEPDELVMLVAEEGETTAIQEALVARGRDIQGELNRRGIDRVRVEGRTRLFVDDVMMSPSLPVVIEYWSEQDNERNHVNGFTDEAIIRVLHSRRRQGIDQDGNQLWTSGSWAVVINTEGEVVRAIQYRAVEDDTVPLSTLHPNGDIYLLYTLQDRHVLQVIRRDW